MSKFDAYLAGKSVCLVAPGASLEGRGMGALIDSYDVVARIGHALPIPPEQHADFGTRCDVLYENLWFWRHGLNDKIDQDSVMRAYLDSNLRFLRYVWRQDQQLTHFEAKNEGRIPVSVVDAETFERWRRLIRARSESTAMMPTKGIAAVLDLWQSQASRVFLTGFTFSYVYGYAEYVLQNPLYIHGNPYPPNAETITPRYRKSGGHSSDAELKICAEVLEDPRFTCDDALSAVLNQRERV